MTRKPNVGKSGGENSDVGEISLENHAVENFLKKSVGKKSEGKSVT